MATEEKNPPIYNRRVQKVLKEIAKGRSREEIANDFDYSTWKSLDMYMRRKGFKYDSKKETYIPEIEKVEDERSNVSTDKSSSKIDLIISLFDEELSPDQIAEKTGFKDHKEIAQYMKEKGYKWDSEKANYIKEKTVSNDDMINNTKMQDEVSLKENSGNKSKVKKRNLPNNLVEMLEYKPLIEKLSEHEDKLDKLLEKEITGGEIPNYTLYGESNNKGFYMNRKLIKLLEKYSDEKNIKQNMIVEGALIEFLRKYGFHEEVKSLMKS